MSHYKTLRSALAKKLAGDALILLDGGKPVPRNFDVDYAFRQNSDFLYLTGVEEPGCHLVIDPKSRRETLFVPRIDNHHRVWEGHVPSPAEARVLFGVDRVMYADEMKKTRMLVQSLRRMPRKRCAVSIRIHSVKNRPNVYRAA